MNFISKELLDYAEQHSESEPILLQELRRETWQKVLAPRMLSGHLQGRLLSLISKLTKPKLILEIGTYTGYSTLCLAEGLQDTGLLYTIDNNEELFDFQLKYFKKSGLSEVIIQKTGEALDIIPTLPNEFDLIFIDADKKNYSNYFDLVVPKLNKNGIILSDNVLWSGKVLNETKKNDIDTAEIKHYNKKIKEDSRVETILLPFRDGISICRKK